MLTKSTPYISNVYMGLINALQRVVYFRANNSQSYSAFEPTVNTTFEPVGEIIKISIAQDIHSRQSKSACALFNRAPQLTQVVSLANRASLLLGLWLQKGHGLIRSTLNIQIKNKTEVIKNPSR